MPLTPLYPKKSECAALTLYLLYTLPETCKEYRTNRTRYKCRSTPITFLLKETLSYFVSLALSKQLLASFSVSDTFKVSVSCNYLTCS